MKKLTLEELNRLTVEEFKKAPKLPFIVVLDNIRSMHNVGSIFRTADAFRIEKLYLCGITPQPPHREIQKTAIGAQDSVDWEYADKTIEVIRTLKEEGYLIIVAEQTDGGITLEEIDILPEIPYAIVLGHEVYGVDQEVLELADLAAEIPQYGTKHSLNISVAAGIFMYKLTTAMRMKDTSVS